LVLSTAGPLAVALDAPANAVIDALGDGVHGALDLRVADRVRVFLFLVPPPWPWCLPRAWGASPPVPLEPMLSSEGGAGGMAATIDISTALARAFASCALLKEPAEPSR